jgi:predicted nucleic acid-binding protein
MILLDTNVLSELMRPVPDGKVRDWFDAQETEDLWISSITVAEIKVGIARLPEGKRKSGLTQMARTLFAEDFAERILSFDSQAASHYAELVATREKAGRPISMADAQIAAICKGPPVKLPVLATRNSKDFAGLGITLINPWLSQ